MSNMKSSLQSRYYAMRLNRMILFAAANDSSAAVELINRRMTSC